MCLLCLTCPVRRHQRSAQKCCVEQLSQPRHLMRVVNKKLLWFIHTQLKLCHSQKTQRCTLQPLDLKSKTVKNTMSRKIMFIKTASISHTVLVCFYLQLTCDRDFISLLLSFFGPRCGCFHCAATVRHGGCEALESVFEVCRVTDVGLFVELTGCRETEEEARG